MTSAALLPILGQLAVAILGGGVVVAVINNFISPKTKAETKAIAQKTAQETIDQALDNLRKDLADARLQIDKAIKRADTAEEKFDAAEAKLDAIAIRDRILVQYLWDLKAWSQRYYESGHPPQMPPPPTPPPQLDELLN